MTIEGSSPTAIVVGEIVGWRFWRISSESNLLWSVTLTGHEWLPGLPMRGDPGAIPSMPFSRPGVYAFVDMSTALQETGEALTKYLIGGSVYLYGLVIVHSKGYRASHAVVKEVEYIGGNTPTRLTAAQWTERYNVNQQE